MRPAKTQISLGIRPVWSESSLGAQWVAKGPMFLHADSEDSDQTGWMPRLIWVIAGRTATLLVLSCRGSNFNSIIVEDDIPIQDLFYWCEDNGIKVDRAELLSLSIGSEKGIHWKQANHIDSTRGNLNFQNNSESSLIVTKEYWMLCGKLHA